MRRWSTLLLVHALLLQSGLVIAESRIALVIGNGAYGADPLSDPPNDATLIAKTLRTLDFDVVERTNRDQKTMRRLIRDFAKRLKEEKASVGLFYYSGHGIQVGGRNYMIPIGADIQDEVDVPSVGVGLDEVLGRMDTAGNALNIIILDACRNNPYEKSYKATGDGGLAKVLDIPKGSLIAFAAEPRKVALQGKGQYSIFTEALAEEIIKPGVDIKDIFTRVRIRVYNKTKNKQFPTVDNRLLVEKFFFRPASAPSLPTPGPGVVRVPTGDALGEGMVRISGGCFQMGSLTYETGRNTNEGRHEVCVDAFAMGKYEVTNAEYRRFRPGHYSGATLARRMLNTDDQPVVRVTWNDAVAYADWLSQQTGKRYRLPTEAEWEYAARAGTDTAYWWGDAVGRNNANCNSCGSRWDGKQSAPVGSFSANPWGLYGTAGNVWEWTCSAVDEAYAGGEKACADVGEGGHRVFRGGSWLNAPQYVRSATRGRHAPEYQHNDVGFRLAQDL